MKKILIGLVLLVLLLIIVLVIKTFTYPFTPTKDLANSPEAFPINEKAVKRLSEAIQIPTVSNVVYESTNFEPFNQFQAFLKTSYPLIKRLKHIPSTNMGLYSIGKVRTLLKNLYCSYPITM